MFIIIIIPSISNQFTQNLVSFIPDINSVFTSDGCNCGERRGTLGFLLQISPRGVGLFTLLTPDTRNKNKPIDLSKVSVYLGFLIQEMFRQCGLEISPAQNILMKTFVIVVSVVEQYC